jgi:hypothetical protein
MVRPDEDGLAYRAKLALEFQAVWRRHHCADGYGVPFISRGDVEDLAVLLARFFEDVLGFDEAVWDKPPEPVKDVDDVVFPLFFVHVAMTWSILTLMEGWFPCWQYKRAFLHDVVALRWLGDPNIMTCK